MINVRKTARRRKLLGNQYRYHHFIKFVWQSVAIEHSLLQLTVNCPTHQENYILCPVRRQLIYVTDTSETYSYLNNLCNTTMCLYNNILEICSKLCKTYIKLSNCGVHNSETLKHILYQQNVCVKV
jgi:hypothetical protein